MKKIVSVLLTVMLLCIPALCSSPIELPDDPVDPPDFDITLPHGFEYTVTEITVKNRPQLKKGTKWLIYCRVEPPQGYGDSKAWGYANIKYNGEPVGWWITDKGNGDLYLPVPDEPVVLSFDLITVSVPEDFEYETDITVFNSSEMGYVRITVTDAENKFGVDRLYFHTVCVNGRQLDKGEYKQNQYGFEIPVPVESVVVTYGISTEDPDPPSGDVNGDGKTNNKDVVALFRRVSGSEVAANESAADFNGDGKVNNKDVVALFRYISSQ